MFHSITYSIILRTNKNMGGSYTARVTLTRMDILAFFPTDTSLK